MAIPELSPEMQEAVFRRMMAESIELFLKATEGGVIAVAFALIDRNGQIATHYRGANQAHVTLLGGLQMLGTAIATELNKNITPVPLEPANESALTTH